MVLIPCPHCGWANRPAGKFCASCGRKRGEHGAGRAETPVAGAAAERGRRRHIAFVLGLVVMISLALGSFIYYEQHHAAQPVAGVTSAGAVALDVDTVGHS